jgi:hypothetical protein
VRRVDRLEARLAELVPQEAAYSALKPVFWPFTMRTSAPNVTNDVLSTDSRGYRLSRVGDRVARSDQAPPDAGFVLGGSAAFGVGASSDSGTFASALWRRTGIPFVNLGIRAGSSLQELISVLPYARRETTFVLLTGMNNIARARGGDEVDPLFGPIFGDHAVRPLTALPVEKIAQIVADPLATVGDEALEAELARRRLGSAKSRRTSLNRKPKRAPASQELVSAALSRQIADLELVSRVVPDAATVLVVVQPFEPEIARTRTPEEEEIFRLRDTVKNVRVRETIEALRTYYPSFRRGLAEGCRALSLPFVDLSDAAFEGWCFVDRWHMTDRGYDAAAAAVEDLVPDRGPSLEGAAVSAEHAGGPAHADALEEEYEDDDANPSVYPLW